MIKVFARMLRMEGVRAPDQPKQLRATSSEGVEPPQKVGSVGHAWITGPRALIALETARERLTTEIHDGRRGWATEIRRDGATATLPASSGAASLLVTADRMSLQLMIGVGDGWTYVMHSLMGVATLDADPAEP